MAGLLFLIGSFLLGIALIRRIFPFASGAENVFWGASLGIVVSTWAGYLVSRILSEVNFTILWILIALMWIGSIFLLRTVIRESRGFSFADSLRENKYLIILLTLFVPIFLYFFHAGMFRGENGGMLLTLTSWYDMALHLALANSFVYAQNFPPMYPVLPGEALHYPFLPDFHAAVLLKLGWSIWATFAVTSFVMAVTLVGTFYCFARRLANSNSAAFTATILFFLNGGLGFLLFFRDWYAGDKSLFAQFLNPQTNYTDSWGEGIKWANLITSGFIPQRAMLYGMPIAFFVLALMAIVWKGWSEKENEGRWDGARILFAAGVITGLLPLFHVHSYMAVGFISGFLFLARPRLAWIIFWLPAVLLALPQVIGVGSSLPTSEFLQVHLGWMSYTGGNFYVFLLMNFGLPLLLIIPAIYAAPRYLKTFYIPFAAIIIFCFIFRISPNDFDNLKLMYYWHAATAVLVAVWLNKLAVMPKVRFLVPLIVLICTASGILATMRERTLMHQIFTADEIEAGIFSRDRTEPDAIFLTGQNHNQAALCFGGRRIVLGYDFWIISHGYSRQMYDSIKANVKQIYSGAPEAEVLLEQQNVDYIYIGPHETSGLNANTSYFSERHTLVFKNATISIFKVKGPGV